MKVLHIIDKLHFGGAQTLLKNYFEKEKNKNLTLISLRKSANEIEINHSNIIKMYSSKFSIPNLKKIVSIIRKKKIEIIHAHLTNSLIVSILIKFKCPHIKVIYHEHGKIHENSIGYKILLKVSRHFIDKYIAVSNYTKKELKNKVKIKNNEIVVISNFTVKKKNKNLKYPKKIKNIGYIGRLCKIKGIDVLLNSIKKLDKSIQLMIVGDGTLKKTLEQKVKNQKLEKRVKFLGYQIRPFEQLKECDLIIVPSRSESFGLTVIEAQRKGKIVLASNIPAIKELITPNINGFLFRAADPKSLANQVRQINRNLDKITPIIINNALESSNKYTIENYILKCKKTYHEISKR